MYNDSCVNSGGKLEQIEHWFTVISKLYSKMFVSQYYSAENFMECVSTTFCYWSLFAKWSKWGGQTGNIP